MQVTSTKSRHTGMALRIAIAALALSLPAQAQQAPRWPKVDAALQPLVEQGKLAGLVTVVRKDGRIVHQSATGKRDLASGAPAEMDTIFRAFSMTKPVTATAMMILWDEGKWKPEDPVSKFLPELKDLKVYKGRDANGQPILATPQSQPTMGELMTHSAGFAYGLMPGPVDDLYRAAQAAHQPANADEYVAMIARLPLAYDPGTQWQYSVSVDLQGIIVERLSGMSLADFMAKRIFGPLKMVDSGFYVPAAKRGRFATLYGWQDGHLVPLDSGMFASRFAEPPKVASGGGGLVTTALDYSRFGQMLVNGGTLDGARILSPAAVHEMMSNHIPPALVNGHFGIGFQQIRPGYQFGYDGVVVTDPEAAKVAMGKGSYLWDGAAGTWFWVDPTNKLVFVGMIQRIMSAGGMPPVQDISQRAVKATLESN
jgi:CubicO group peptidase (beta-lactamase class C family)